MTRGDDRLITDVEVHQKSFTGTPIRRIDAVNAAFRSLDALVDQQAPASDHRMMSSYREAWSIGQLAQGVNRPGASTCLDLHDLHPIDAGRAGKFRLGQVSQLAPHLQRRLSIDETVNHTGRDQPGRVSWPRRISRHSRSARE